jgi:hypothetical protein
MLLRIYAFFCCCILWLPGCGQSSSSNKFIPVTDTLVYTIGDTPVTLTLRTYNTPNSLFFIHLHDNEATAEETTISHLEKHGGQLLSIENKQQRNISFRINNQSFTFDPNRIFSDTGIRATLKRLSLIDTFAHKAVSSFASFVLSYIPDTALIVAMHNNTDRQFSALSYQVEPLLKEAAMLHINPEADADNFIITTDSLLFLHYKNKNMNAILQRRWPLPDDGSLSIYFSKKDRIYINIEAEHKQATEQGLLLKELFYFTEQKKKLSSEIK